MTSTSMQQLSETLRQKKQEEQERIEKETLNELRKHAKSLRDGLAAELTTTLEGTSVQISKLKGLIAEVETAASQAKIKATTSLETSLEDLGKVHKKHQQAVGRTLVWGWLRYSLPALAGLASICAGSWGLMQYLSHTIQSQLQEATQGQKVLRELPRGVEFLTTNDGNYLIFQKKPEPYETDSGKFAIELPR